MKIQITLFISLFLSVSIYAQISSSKWQTKPIIVDGDASDWESIPRFFNSESNVQYEFRNDSQNLYVVLRSTNRNTQFQLLRAGFSVKLKVKTQPVTKVSITFPPKKIGNIAPIERNNDKLVDKFNTNPELMFKDSAVLDGFIFSKGIITSENSDSKGIRFAKNKGSRDQVVFEIQIPFREIFGNDFKLSEIAKIPMQLQVNINDLSQSSMREMHGRMGRGMRGDGSGMRGEGGMRGGGEMGSMNEGGEIGMSQSGEMAGGMNGGYEMGGREKMQGGGWDANSMSRKSFSIDFKLSVGN